MRGAASGKVGMTSDCTSAVVKDRQIVTDALLFTPAARSLLIKHHVYCSPRQYRPFAKLIPVILPRTMQINPTLCRQGIASGKERLWLPDATPARLQVPSPPYGPSASLQAKRCEAQSDPRPRLTTPRINRSRFQTAGVERPSGFFPHFARFSCPRPRQSPPPGDCPAIFGRAVETQPCTGHTCLGRVLC